MCECGCGSMADRYRFPAPNEAIYLLSLYPACTNCDVPPGITLELITREHTLWAEYQDGDWYCDGPLPFEQWHDSKGVAIVAGMRSDEFVKAMLPHLVGVDSNELGEGGVLDEAGAEVIAEEMYADACTKPRLVQEAAK